MLIRLLTDPDVRRHLGGPVDEATVDQLRTATVGERPDSFVVVSRATDRPIGAVNLGHERDQTEVSYQFLRSAWGQGYATEAVGALIAWTWATRADETLIAVTQSANERSCRLLERLGFTFDRAFEEFDAPQSQYRIDRPSPGGPSDG